MQEIDISKDVSGYTKRLLDYLSQSTALGITVGLEVSVSGLNGERLVVSRYFAAPLDIAELVGRGSRVLEVVDRG